MIPLWDFEIHKESLFKRYYSGPCSNSTVVVFIGAFTLMVIPLFVAYSSWGIPYAQCGFWYKEGTYLEQPILDYRHQGVVQLHGRSGSDNFNLYYSTSSVLNQQQGSTLRSGIIQSATFDDNHDGIVDRLELQVSMPLLATEEVHGMSATFFHDVKLKDKAKVVFDSVSSVNFESGDVAISSVAIGGDLSVKTTEPLTAGGKYKVPYLNNPLLPETKAAGVSAVTYGIREVLQTAASRAVSSSFQQTYATAVRIMGEHATEVGIVAKTFTATINLRVPTQPIRIQPAIAEVLKVAWTQYMPFFLLCGLLLHRVLSFVFSNRLVTARPVGDIIVQKEE